MPKVKEWKDKWMMKRCGGGMCGSVYGLGVIGAIVYYFQHSVTAAAAVFGVVKALLWPALVVFRALEFFKM